MIQLLIFSLISAAVLATLMAPFGRVIGEDQIEEPIGVGTGVSRWIGTLIFFTIALFIFYYVTNWDRQWTSLWLVALVAAIVGAVLSVGKERKIKGVLTLVLLAGSVYIVSAPLWNATDKYEAMEMKEQVEITPFDETQKPASVPPKFVRNKMKKAFGQVPNTSYYELGHLQIQKVNGEYVYIAPVEFSGFFKWWKGKEIPGYFVMSATDAAANPKFVKQPMTYTPSSFFGKKVERHMRMSDPQLIFYGDPQLEIDDDGKPFYIRSYGSFISARNGFDVEGIVTVDAQTGATKNYALKDIPAFIDGAVAPEVVSLQNSYYGNYVHGFWNTIFGKKDIKIPSDEGTESNVSPVFDAEGNMHYFTDFTSPKEGVDSMLGYALTDARTGEGTYYTGNLEESYMDSEGALQIVEKKFIEKKWSGQMPLIYNFYGEASWLVPVMDSNGFLQNYFIVSAANPEISVYANSPNDALKLYKTALQRGGSVLDGTSEGEEKQQTVTVVRLHKETFDQQTVVTVLANDGTSYVLSTEIDPLAMFIEEGDVLDMTYVDTGDALLPVKSFTNATLAKQMK